MVYILETYAQGLDRSKGYAEVAREPWSSSLLLAGRTNGALFTELKRSGAPELQEIMFLLPGRSTTSIRTGLVLDLMDFPTRRWSKQHEIAMLDIAKKSRNPHSVPRACFARST